MTSKPLVIGAALAFSALVVTAIPMSAAHAHSHLLSSQPADKAMAMPAPTALTLKFSEGLELKLSKVVVTGPDKKEVKTGAIHLAPTDDKVLLVPLPSPLPDGIYKVDWQAVAKDGHKTAGSFSFDAMQ